MHSVSKDKYIYKSNTGEMVQIKHKNMRRNAAQSFCQLYQYSKKTQNRELRCVTLYHPDFLAVS